MYICVLCIPQLDWKERLEASERMVSVLQERLETTRSQLYDQDKLVGQLRSDLQVDAEELHYWKEQRGQDMEKLEQVSVLLNVSVLEGYWSHNIIPSVFFVIVFL